MITFMVAAAGMGAGFIFTIWLRGSVRGPLLVFGTVSLTMLNAFTVSLALEESDPSRQLLLPMLWAVNGIAVIFAMRRYPTANPAPAADPLDPAIAAEVAKHMRKRTCSGVDAAALRLHLVSEHGDTADLLATDRVVTLAHNAKYGDCITPQVWNETRVRTQLATLSAYLDLVNDTVESPA